MFIIITGDSEHKPYIISEPDVKSIQLEGDEDFLILACDGLWDTVTPQDAALTVYKHILSSPGKNFDMVVGILSFTFKIKYSRII